MRNKKSEEKYLSVVIGLSLFLWFFASHPIMGISNVQTRESSSLIQTAFDENKIDKDAYLLHQVQAIFAPRTLPMAYKSDATTTSVQDFTPLVKEISLNWNTLREETQRELKPLLLRPTGLYYKPFSKLPNMAYTDKDVISYDTVHFRIHYVRSTDDAPSLDDPNSNDIPDYVERMGDVFENVYKTEINIMGYAVPPDDDTKGGDSKIDVYIKNIGKYKLYGWASPEGPIPESSWSWYSFIVMDNDYSEFNTHKPLENLQVTAAHEFHHCVQFGYNAYTENWLMEATSSWIEDEVYDGVNNNILYLDSDDGIFTSPDISLNSTDRYNSYSIWIWIRYLSERYGIDIIRNIWDKCKLDNNYLHAISEALIERKTNLANTFLDFSARNYSKKMDKPDPSEPYKEGVSYPNIYIENNRLPHKVYPVSTQTKKINHLASTYIKFLPQTGATSKTLQISFDGPDGKDCGACVVIKMKIGDFIEQRIPLDDRNDGSINVSKFSTNVGNDAEVNPVESVVLIMNNTTLTNDNLEFSYSAMYRDDQVAQVTPQ